MADEKFYYELEFDTDAHVWEDHEDISLTGPTYESVVEKAKRLNLDIGTADLAKWHVRLAYRGGFAVDGGSGIVDSLYLHASTADDGTQTRTWDDTYAITSDPVVLRRAEATAKTTA